MAKLTTPAQTAETLSVRERVLLLWIASGTDWTKVGITGGPTVKGLLVGARHRRAELARPRQPLASEQRPERNAPPGGER